MHFVLLQARQTLSYQQQYNKHKAMPVFLHLKVLQQHVHRLSLARFLCVTCLLSHKHNTVVVQSFAVLLLMLTAAILDCKIGVGVASSSS